MRAGDLSTRARAGRSAVLAALVLALGLVGAAPAGADAATWERTQDIAGEPGDLELDGNRMAAANFGDGVIDVFERSGAGQPFALAATISPPPGYVFVNLSNMQVALGGDRIVVKSTVFNDPGLADDQDKLLVFDRDPVTGTWLQAAQLDPQLPNITSLSVHGGAVTFVSFRFFCFSAEDCATDREAFVEGWQLDATSSAWTRTLSLSTLHSQFPSVALDDEHLVVRHEPGTIRVLDPVAAGTGWIETASITGPPGRWVAVDDDRIVATAESDVAVYEREGGAWTLDTTIPDVAAGGGQPEVLRLSGNGFVFATRPVDGYSGPNLFLYERDLGTGAWSRSNVPDAPVGKIVFGLDVDGGTAAASFGTYDPRSRGGYPEAIRVFERVAPVGPDTDGDGTPDADDADDDGDALPDANDPAPLDADNDDDGIVDGQDVEHVQDLVTSQPSTAFTAPGIKTAINAQLDQVEARVAAGDHAGAIRRLEELRSRTDGCGAQADRTDWVKDCDVQVQLRTLIDLLIAALS